MGQKYVSHTQAWYAGMRRPNMFDTFDTAVQTIVNLGTGYETLGISKAGTIQSQLDVEPTLTLHNLLFLVRKLILKQKHETKKLVEFHNQPTSINYVQTNKTSHIKHENKRNVLSCLIECLMAFKFYQTPQNTIKKH